jgi:hypothetical protein
MVDTNYCLITIALGRKAVADYNRIFTDTLEETVKQTEGLDQGCRTRQSRHDTSSVAQGATRPLLSHPHELARPGA